MLSFGESKMGQNTSSSICRRFALIASAFLASYWFVIEAHAALIISSGATNNVTCTATTCYPTANTCVPPVCDSPQAEAVLNVGQLENLLASSSVTVTTTGLGSVQAYELDVGVQPGDGHNAGFTWSSSNTLTLQAEYQIVVREPISVTGAGGLVLSDDGTTSLTRTGTLGKDTFLGQINFSNLGGSLSINGTTYTLVADLASLASDVASNTSGAFALANNVTATGTYTASPIPTVFYGTFEGLGHTIDKLDINDTAGDDDVGLFSNDFGYISDVGLTHEKVSGTGGANVGGIVGYHGTITNSFVNGNIKGGYGTSVGGISGNYATLSDSYSSGTVTAGNGQGTSAAGGLSGFDGTISNSYSTSTVSGVAPFGYFGGLIGGIEYGYGGVVDSFATGTVSATGTSYIGGLIGYGSSSGVQSSFSSSNISSGATSTAGGLVGDTTGSISSSFASGTVSASDGSFVGGLLGTNDGSVQNSGASGAVSAGNSSYAGGLSGAASSTADANTFATGSADGGTSSYVGGLLGASTDNQDSTSYASGLVQGPSGSTGGLIGNNSSSTFTNTYWDITTSGTGTGVGNGTFSGVTGLDSADLSDGQMLNPPNYLPTGFDSGAWTTDAGVTFPYLMPNLTQLNSNNYRSTDGEAWLYATSACYAAVDDMIAFAAGDPQLKIDDFWDVSNEEENWHDIPGATRIATNLNLKTASDFQKYFGSGDLVRVILSQKMEVHAMLALEMGYDGSSIIANDPWTGTKVQININPKNGWVEQVYDPKQMLWVSITNPNTGKPYTCNLQSCVLPAGIQQLANDLTTSSLIQECPNSWTYCVIAGFRFGKGVAAFSLPNLPGLSQLNPSHSIRKSTPRHIFRSPSQLQP